LECFRPWAFGSRLLNQRSPFKYSKIWKTLKSETLLFPRILDKGHSTYNHIYFIENVLWVRQVKLSKTLLCVWYPNGA
jgi:hypothetical protein